MILRRTAAVVAAVLLGSTLSALTAPVAQAAPPSWAALRHQFDYAQQPIDVRILATRHVRGAEIRDLTYRALGHAPVRAYLVTPTSDGVHPAAMFLHWLDGATDSNRGEFLHEAIWLAEGPQHVESLLPQLTFPFAYGPVGDVRDRDSIVTQVVQLRRGLDLLDARHDVDASRVAVVGHDYGAMYGSILSAVDQARVHASVVMAADATMADWFVTYFLDLPPEDVQPYTHMLTSVDPVRFLAHEPRRLLLQYADDDIYIPATVAHQMRRAAGPTATYLTYPTDHQLAVSAAHIDRDTFLARALVTP